MSVLRKIEVYLRSTGTAPTSFGRIVARDPRLVHDLRNGRELGTRLTARIDAYLCEVAQ